MICIIIIPDNWSLRLSSSYTKGVRIISFFVAGLRNAFGNVGDLILVVPTNPM